MTISIYSSENNFVKQLQIEDKYQDLEIDTKKDQYYYEIDYTQKPSWQDTSLNINFNLNKKDYITITLNIELHYISPIVWMCLSLGIFFMIPISYYGIKYFVSCYAERKKQRKKLNESLVKSVEEEEEEEREAEKRRKEQIREMRRKKMKKLDCKKKKK